MFKTKLYEVYKEQTVKDCYEQTDKEFKKERSNWWFGGQSALSFGYGYTLRETTEYIYEPKNGYDEDCCKI